MKNLHWHAISVFSLASFLVIFLYAGLPFDFTYDLVLSHKSIISMSYPEVFSLIANPLTPAWFYMKEIELLRPVYDLTYKLFIDFFGLSLVPFHIAASVGNGLLATGFFILGATITKKKIYGWLLVFLYASFPTNTPELIGQLVTALPAMLALIYLSATACFGFLTYKRWPTISTRILLMTAWIVLTWLAIKWKSHGKLLPIITFVFLSIRFLPIVKNLGRRFTVILILVNLAMFLLVVPVKTLLEKQKTNAKDEIRFSLTHTPNDQRIFNVNISNIRARMLKQPGSKNPLTTVFLRELPSSFTANLGFFLGWFFWLSFLALPWTIMKTREKLLPTESNSFNFLMHMFILTMTYFGVMVCSFASGAPIENVRFLDLALVPAIILIAYQIRFSELLLATNKARKEIIRGVIILFFLVPILHNTRSLLKWVHHSGGLQHALAETEKMIYKSYYNKEPAAIDLYLNHMKLEQEAVLVSWYDLDSKWYDNALRKISTNGVLFLKTRTESDSKIKLFQNSGLTVEQIGIFRFNNARPLFFKLHQWLILHELLHSKDPMIVLYKVSP